MPQDHWSKPHGDHGYFCAGLAEELINALSRIEGLRVASRTSSFRFLYYRPERELLERAELHSRAAVEADPELPEARASRGLALAARGSYDEAADEFEEALRLREGLFEALYLDGRTCLAQGRCRKAAELFERASTARPDDFHTVTLLAKCLRALGEQDAVLAARRRALNLIEYHLRLESARRA